MNNKNYLVYFLNSMKEELEFVDSTDFKNKIESNFNFKFKIQKFVFLAKYFGWDNSYSHNLYIHGPYSPILADDYYSEDLFNYNPLPIINFDFSSLKRFIKGKSNDYLESASTILFYKKVGKNFSLDFIVKKLANIKPHLSHEIIEESFYDVERLNVVSNNDSNDISEVILNNVKNNLNEKISINIKLFENFETNYNSVFVLGSLDYLRIVLREEKLNNYMKNDLFEIIWDRVEKYVDKQQKRIYKAEVENRHRDVRKCSEKIN